MNGLRSLAGWVLVILLGLAGHLHAQTVVGWGMSNIVPPPGLNNVQAIAAGRYFGLALQADGAVIGWGLNNGGALTIPAGLSDVVAIDAGYAHAIALQRDGTVVCWGGIGAGYDITPPAGLTDVTAISAGEYHCMALKRDGTVVCWGWNLYEQTNVPAGLCDVVAIDGGRLHSLALKRDGTVVGWGDRNGEQTFPPTGLTDVVAISAGVQHSLALTRDGVVVGWGRTTYGVLPPPAGLTDVVAIAAGSFHNLALKRDGTVVGWGNGLAATPPANLRNVLAIAAGNSHSLALALDSNQPPTVEAGDDQRLEASGQLTPVQLNGGQSGDPDGDQLTYVWTNAAHVQVSTEQSPRLMLPVGEQTFTLTVTDPDGLCAADTVRVTVEDTTPPVITCEPEIDVVATSAAGAIVDFPLPTADDLVDGAVAVTCTPGPGARFPLGLTPVMVTACDRQENAATVTMLIHVCYPWSGLRTPANRTTFTCGSTVPLRFRLGDSCAAVADCRATLAYAESEHGPFTPAGDFRYDPVDGQYIANWKTKGLSPGAYWVKVDLGDGLERLTELTLD